MIPTPTIQVTRDDPPRLMKGRAIPVKGIVPVTTAMLTTAWNVIQQVIPTVRSLPKESGDLPAI